QITRPALRTAGCLSTVWGSCKRFSTAIQSCLCLTHWPGICTIFHTSGYDTQTIVNNNGSTEYGLFQINNKFWCRDNQILQSRNICDISCDKFLDDDLTDDMICAKKILDKEGIDYWLAHKPLCSEKLEQWHCEKL
uniref:Lactose synthase B protein n=1 Tax=Ursus americanus TaxID=9643 RepID=A0A452SS98_URSAM